MLCMWHCGIHDTVWAQCSGVAVWQDATCHMCTVYGNVVCVTQCDNVAVQQCGTVTIW